MTVAALGSRDHSEMAFDVEQLLVGAHVTFEIARVQITQPKQEHTNFGDRGRRVDRLRFDESVSDFCKTIQRAVAIVINTLFRCHD